MKYFYFRMNIPYKEFELLYKQMNTVVKVRDEEGRMLQIPAVRFIGFLSQIGVRGRFELVIDGNNKFLQLNRAGI